jgi:uncharacterized membrane protein
LRVSPVQVLFAAVAAWSVLWAVYITVRWGWLLSWVFFVAGPRRMVDLGYPHYVAPGGLQLYASYPRLQIGPLTFLAALPIALLPHLAGEVIGCLFMVASGPAIVWLIADATTRVRGRTRAEAYRAAAWLWFLLAPTWFLLAILWGHLDDVLALLLVTAGVNLLARNRATAAAIAIGASAACKPWAIAFIPMMLAAADGRRVRNLAVAVAASAGPWLPFLVADPHTLRAGAFKIRVIPASVLSLFHVVGGTPSWVRPCQFVGGALLVIFAVRSGRWAAAVVLAMALRLGTDPNVYSYYTTGLLVGACIWDLLGSRLLVPVVTAVCSLTLFFSVYLPLTERDHAIIRLVTVIAVPIMIVLTSEPARRRGGLSLAAS